MKLEINSDKPWITQVRKFERTLHKKAFDQAKGNTENASKLLGISPRTLRNKLNKDKSLQKVVEKYRPAIRGKVNEEQVKLLFEFSLMPNEIGKMLNRGVGTIEKALNNVYTKDEYDILRKRNERYRFKRSVGIMNTQEILENNRVILAEIAEKVRENKVNELTDEYVFYAQVLFKNGLMTKEGNITEEGKNVLYH